MVFNARVLISLIVALAASMSIAVSVAAAAPPAADLSFRPAKALDRGQVVLTRTGAGTMPGTRIQWVGVRRVRVTEPYPGARGAIVDVQDFNRGTSILGTGNVRALRNGLILRNESTITPDGAADLQRLLLGYSWPLITRQRSGIATFTRVRSGRRFVLRGRMVEPSIACVGRKAGMRTVDLDPVTFVPLRVLVTRGGRLDTRITATRFRYVTGALPAIRFVGRTRSRSLGFTARTPQQVANLGAPYRVAMPQALPDGFELDSTGSMRVGAELGPDLDIPPAKGMFAAQWRRGLETLDLTIRTGTDATATAWVTSEPFGYACHRTRRLATTVSGLPASYSLDSRDGARLWWRDGLTMYTLTAPLPRAELVRVAESLVPLSS